MTTITFELAPIARFGSGMSHVFAKLQQALAQLFAPARTDQPVILASITRLQEAEQLRTYARNFASSDPAFSRELFAMAEVHESSAR